ncbi:hypothetical protein GGX14DRAFT_642197 [Mycena pura]|uniref:Transmembrane protein n=1 Tax=Mycena pura TaxID=153505 RepID=A0AAD7E363_9AGAR|nr:hypothetical protein GGX14DRAFT_642197 [Mycena pura]
MPVVHHRRQFTNPFSNIFSGNDPTTTTPAATAPTISATTASATDATATDILGGLPSVINSVISIPSPTVSTAPSATFTSSSTFAAVISTKPTTPSSTSSAFLAAASTTASATNASATVSSSSSASATPTTSSPSIVAAAVVATLVGLVAVAMIVAFFLRRWRRRRRRTRESINFGDAVRRSTPVTPEKENPSPKYDQKVSFADAVNAPYPLTTMTAPATAHRPEVPASSPGYAYTQQPQQVYSPHPCRGYPSPAQQIMYEFQGAYPQLVTGPPAA